MSIELYPAIAKIKRNGVYENLPGFVPETGSIATQQMIASAESSATAQYVHNKGEYFRLNDTLYQAIVKINIGDSIVVGTNCEVAVIGNDLSKIANSIADYELGIATSAHRVGEYFMVAETMYVATADIQVGDAISTSTNCQKAVVGNELSNLKTAITQKIEPLYDSLEIESINGNSIIYSTDIYDIILNGQANGIYDGTIVVDGENVAISTTNGQTTNCNMFFIHAGIINKAAGETNFISDLLPRSAAGDVEKVSGRAANSAIEIALLKTKCNYSVAAANEYFKAHPLRLWFQTPNFASATEFYHILNCSDTDFFLNIGTTRGLPQLSSSDTLSFRDGYYKIGNNTGNVDISAPISIIKNGATVSASGNLTTNTLINVPNKLNTKVSKDGWNEVQPLNTTFFDGLNYFDINKATIYNDRFADTSGKITEGINLTSIVFPVKPDTTYWFFTANMNRFIVVESETSIFNIAETYTVLHSYSESTPTQITTGHTAKYVFAYIANYVYDFTENTPILNENSYRGSEEPYVPYKYLPADLDNPLDNLNVLIFGDSITDTCNFTINASDETTAVTWRNPSNSYVDAGGNTITFSMWPKILKESQPLLEVRNYARSGASYKTQSRSEGEERQNVQYQIDVAMNDLDNPNNVFAVDNFVPDIVIFALGTNDGAPDDTFDTAMEATVLQIDDVSIDVEATLAALDDTKTIASARKAFMRIKQQFPMAQIYCVLPIQRANNDTNFGTLHQYLEQMANRYGCIVIDGTSDSGITRDFNTWNDLGMYLKDGLHPNEKGQNLMARMIISSLKSHFMPFGTGFNS